MIILRTLERANLAIRRDATLGTFLERLARVHGDHALVEQPGEVPLCLTYRQAAKRVARWAGGIARRIEPGDRVVVAAPNGYEFLLLCLAAARAGAVVVPVNSLMRKDEINHVIRDSDARLVLKRAADVDGHEPLVGSAPASPDEVAALFYTSGTTGKPKGARLTHRALLGQISAAALYPSFLRRDEAVVSLPVAHIMGFIVVAGMAAAGIPTYLLPHFRPDEVLDAIEQRRATIFIGVPAMYRLMLEAGAAERDLRSVRLWASGADAMPEDLARQFKRFGATATLPFVHATLGEAVFAEGYGMVELGGGAAAKISPPFLNLPVDDFLGFALPGYHFRVVDDEGDQVRRGEVGELWVRGPGMLRGYHGDPHRSQEVFTEDGWLRTGDLARRGPLGMVQFAGRSKDVIMHGGYSVFAVEVEQKLEQHPSVAEAVVVGLPDERFGEIPAAVVRIAPGATLTAPELTAWAADQMADYKVPQRIVFATELPRTGTNKVQKAALRQLFA